MSATTVAPTPESRPVSLLDDVRPRTVKASVRVPASPTLRSIVAAVLERSGPKKSVASVLKKDRSLVRRQVQAGTTPLRDLEAIGDDFLVDIAEEVLEQIGGRSTPARRARAVLSEVRGLCDVLEK